MHSSKILILSADLTRNLQAMLLFLTALLLSFQLRAESIALVTGEFPPYTGKNLAEGGISSDIITRVFKRMGDKTEIDFAPWKRGYVDTLKRKYLGTFPYTKNAEREKIWLYSAPLYQLQEHFFSPQKAPFNFTEESQLTGKKICKPNGYNLFGLKKLAQQEKIMLVRPANMDNCFAMVDAGRVDLTMTNETTSKAIIDKLGFDQNRFFMAPRPFVKIAHHLIVSKELSGGTALIARFNRALKQLKEEGVIEKIFQQHRK